MPSLTPKTQKIAWLIFVAVIVGILEIFSLTGLALPSSIALPLFSGIILLTAYKTVFEGIKALFRLGFKNINLLMVIAITGAFYLGHYEEGAIVAVLFSLAEHLEEFGMSKSLSALESLVEKMPKVAYVKGESLPVPLSEIEIGDIIIIKPFQVVPLDGEVVGGGSFVDESTITGEPIAKDKRLGDPLFAGSINKQGMLEVKVTSKHTDTTVARIQSMTLEALQNKAETEKFIEKFSSFYTPAILVLAISWSFYGWFIMQEPFDTALAPALILLVISCPCALVISTPIAFFSSIGNASSIGALVKGGRYLEAIGQVKALGLDKTRTLTYGKPIVTDLIPYGDHSSEDLLSCAAGIELFSEHPLSQSIVDAARKAGLNPHEIENFEKILGKGAKADCLVCEDRHHCIGKLQFILEEHDVPEKVMRQIEALQNEGKTVTVISSHKEIEGLIAMEDEVRSDSASLIQALQAMNVTPFILTGDHSASAHALARKIGVDIVYADLLPEDKSHIIASLKQKYGNVGMLGDGINDAPAIAISSVGIALSSLSKNVAMEAASIIILNENLQTLPYLIKLGRETLNTIKFNTAFAISVKFMTIALALIGISNLALAIFADVGVTLIVILYSLRLMHWKL